MRGTAQRTRREVPANRDRTRADRPGRTAYGPRDVASRQPRAGRYVPVTSPPTWTALRGCARSPALRPEHVSGVAARRALVLANLATRAASAGRSPASVSSEPCFRGIATTATCERADARWRDLRALLPSGRLGHEVLLPRSRSTFVEAEACSGTGPTFADQTLMTWTDEKEPNPCLG